MEGGRPAWLSTLLSAIRGTFRPGGRALFSELAIYWLVAILLKMALAIPLAVVLSEQVELRRQIDDALTLVFVLPLPALLARRLHDQNRSALYLLLAAPGIALEAARKAVSLSQGIEARVRFDAATWPLDVLATVAGIALLLLMFFPGTHGPNRFGPDPRGTAPV
ncbi:MAG TPA: DUF805 domain-containing protein [Novosphingobium sp.]|nr:DUF805 domain-containing protein [Novosphingobium sp.]